jgi:beta-1,4-mannosyl-glycoprotein beta-1,4-N-acetylglucosaminyltransferase
MIYDCFTFFNELDLLELRLKLLYDVVDKFVLVESTKTFSNLNKVLFYESNKKRFTKYQDKIIHIIVSDFPEYKNAWTYENHQRNQIFTALNQCSLDDLIMISDVDELPNPDVISKYEFEEKVYRLVQHQFFFYINYRDLKHLYWLGGTRVLRYSIIKNNLLNERKIFFNDITFPKYLNTDITAMKIRLYDGCKFIYNGGWHFSYLGGIDSIIMKIQSFSHQELNNKTFLDPKRIEECLISGKDVFGRSNHRFVCVKVDKKTHPLILNAMPFYENYFLKSVTAAVIPIRFVYWQLIIIKLKRLIKKHI